MNKPRLSSMGLILLIMILQVACDKGTAPAEETVKFSLEGKNAQVFITARDTEFRLSDQGDLEFSDFEQPDEKDPTLMIDPKKQFQEITGFGGALTDAAAETWAKLPEDKQEEIIRAYFDSEKGIGYKLCRIPIHSCDFSSHSYTYTTQENDSLLESFTIEPDRAYKLPFIKQAIEAAGDQLNLFASPWSPPAWMKSNNNMLQGGKLLPAYYQTWADYYIRFIEEYTKEGIPIWGISVQNEPMAVQRWESCIYTAVEERDFVRDYLGPTVEKSDFPDTKIVIWDHNRGIMYQRAKVVYDDPEASKYVWGTGYHWYVGDHFENVKLHAEAFPDKKMLFTEGCAYPFNRDSLDLWKWGETYGRSMIQDMNNGATGWIDWNVLLDETGGPNHVYNFCYAPVIGDTKTGEVIYMNSYYYLGHFSKFVNPGAKRIVCSSNYDDLQGTAFLNPDGSIAVVVLNLTDNPIKYSAWIEGRSVETESLPHSISTLLIK